MKLVFIPLVMVISLAACTEKSVSESDVFTLYSTNHPIDSGRSGVATFDLAKEPFNSQMCIEAADLYTADFERKKGAGLYPNAKMRYWCEKGRFKQ